MSSSIPRRRLGQLVRSLSEPTSTIGTLKLGDITYQVPAATSPAKLPHIPTLLSLEDAVTLDNLHFLLQKYLLGQDVFIVSQPGPYARRLAMTFCRLINAEYEYLALHRDVGETELKQGREIREGGNLSYVDSAAVRAVKLGRILVIEGIEKAERGIMPVLNNLLENREINLDDGTHILHPHRYELLDSEESDKSTTTFVPAHRNFRVLAIGAPVPPYKGNPLDPPFRSRFQARFIDPVGSLLALGERHARFIDQFPSSVLVRKLQELIISTQYASEARSSIDAISRSTLPAFPQTAILKLNKLVSCFPPPPQLTPDQLAKLLVTIYPGLLHAPFEGWATLSRQTEEAGLGPLGAPVAAGIKDGTGLLGYYATAIERVGDSAAVIHFERSEDNFKVSLPVPAGSKRFRPFPLEELKGILITKRFLGLLVCFLQAHALNFDITLIPPLLPSTATSSSSLVIRTFGEVLGYELDSIHLYKELGGRELLMRRHIEDSGATSWKPSPLIQGAWEGKLVRLAGMDVIGATGGSLARLVQDREIELWEGKRMVAEASSEEKESGELTVAHPSFRVICTASKSLPLKDWVTDEHSNMFFPIPAQPMDVEEEATLLLNTGCPSKHVKTLLDFAGRYRQSISADTVQKSRKLGTRSLLRIARRLVAFPWEDDLYSMIARCVLADLLPAVEGMSLDTLLEESGITKKSPLYNPAPSVRGNGLLFFPEASDPYDRTKSVFISRFDGSQDPEGVQSHIPHMEHFYDNSLQTGLMRDIAIDLEVLGEHLVLLGNQGVGKNKIVDRLCQLLGRPREYVQLHRDTTVNQLMFQTTLEAGVLTHKDSPLLRAIKCGRVIVVDEADKAPEHVVAIFRSLGGHGEMTLSDGRRVRIAREHDDDIVVHPNFRLILLANRPGYPFLGNHFLQVLGDNFSCYSVSNPDMESERRLLGQLAPELDENFLQRMVAAFHDLRKSYENGTLTYPYSLRELINLIQHVRKYPNESMESVLRNTFDFEVYKTEIVEVVEEILQHHGLITGGIGLDASRGSSKKKSLEVEFEPQGSTTLTEPKYGKEDPKHEEHHGGNTWAGGTGGRDTAGLGGRGGYMRLFKGHEIKQVSEKLKNEVPDHVREKAREMAKQELARRLEELNMSMSEAKVYSKLLTAVQSHIAQLYDLLENLSAKEEERVWLKRQTDGELDDTRLTEGLTGEAAVYKRRGVQKPEMGQPQIKPKRIRFVFDVSGSMYRFQHDGRLERSLETAVMLMETFDRLSRKDKYVWDIYGHSGDSPSIPLVEAGNPPSTVADRWRVAEKMNLCTQYAFSGDYTLEAIQLAVDEVAKFDADDWIVIAITDANFGRYDITTQDLKRVMDRNPKVHTALVCIGEGAEAVWIPKHFQGRGFRITDTQDIPKVLRSILVTMIDR